MVYMIMNGRTFNGKKMKRSIIMLCSLASVFFACCEKENTVLKLNIKTPENSTKIVLHDGYKPRWNNGDEVLVNATTCVVNGSTTVAPTAESYTAVYPADAVSGSIEGRSSLTINIPSRQTYMLDNEGYQVVKAPMVAYSTGSTLDFHNVCAIMAVYVENQTGEDLIIQDIEIFSSEHSLSGSGTVTAVRTNPILQAGSATSYGLLRPSSFVTLTGINSTVHNGFSSSVYNIYMKPTYDEDNLFTVTVYARSASTGRLYTFSRTQSHSGINLEAGVVTCAKLEATTANRSVLPCFSVANNQQVIFSPGNLICHYSEDTYSYRYWNFCTGYYSLGNNNDFDDDGGDLDLMWWHNNFGWSFEGFSGVVRGREWRLLSHNEWDWLLNSRPSASNLRGPARITSGSTSYDGYILLPDGWVCPAGVSFNSSAGYYWDNSLTSNQWEDMKAAGAVFLPAAGSWYSGVSEVFGYGNTGCYWTSSEGTSANTHYTLEFNRQPSYFSIQQASCTNSQYNSVRMVRDL